MTLDQLQYFYAAAQYENYTRAAEAAHISQPSLCIAIRKLEKELGIALFQTNRKGAVLTDAGRLFMQDTQNILQQVDVAVTHMRQLAQKDRAEIRFAYTSSVAEAYIPRLMKEFLAGEGKDFCIFSDEMSSDQIAQGIREGRIDFGICSQVPVDPELEQIPLLYQRLCMLLPERVDPTPFEDSRALQNATMITYRKNLPMYRLVTNLMDELQVEPNVIHYAYSESAIARLVSQGLGCAIVAEIEGLENYPVQRLHPKWLVGGRNIFLIRHRTRMMTHAARQLVQRVLEKKES